MGNTAGDSAYCSDSGKLFLSHYSDRARDNIWKAHVCRSCSRLCQKLFHGDTLCWNLLIKNALARSNAGRIVGFTSSLLLLPLSKLLPLFLGLPQSWEFPRPPECCCCSGMCAGCSQIKVKGTVKHLGRLDDWKTYFEQTLVQDIVLNRLSKEPAIHLAMVSSFYFMLLQSGWILKTAHHVREACKHLVCF